MKNQINIAVVGLGQVGIYLLNELNTKKKDIELKTGKKINIVAVSARSISKKRRFNVRCTHLQDCRRKYAAGFNRPLPSLR